MNTRTLAVITITVMLVITTQQRELQIQIVKLAVRGNTARPLESLRAKVRMDGK